MIPYAQKVQIPQHWTYFRVICRYTLSLLLSYF